MSADLVAFLRERLDADGQIARAAAGTGTGRWTQNSDDLYGHTGRVEDEHGEAVVYDEGAPTEDEAKHIARWDPARVLADIEAKRNLLRAAVSARNDHRHWNARPPADPEARTKVLAQMDARWSAWHYVLTQLAAEYSGHPGYAEALASLD